MKSNNGTTYYVVFDTNVLFKSYGNSGDFNSFGFNSTFDNVVDMVNKFDIYEHIELAIPTVVWRELEKQIIEKHDELLPSYEKTITKELFPEYSITKNEPIDYPEYIGSKILSYKNELSNGFNKVIELPLATKSRYDSLVDRSFNKLPPFEGKNKSSDKGFKDALLWESILEFASGHPHSEIIYYSRDNAFGEYLRDEFSKCNEDSTLFICKNELEVKSQLETCAKKINEFSYIPPEDSAENEAITNWLNSEDFISEISQPRFKIAEKSRLVVSSSISLSNIGDIELIDEDEKDRCEYSVDVTLDVLYEFKNGERVSETINVNIQVDSIGKTAFYIQNAYSADDVEDESEE